MRFNQESLNLWIVGSEFLVVGVAAGAYAVVTAPAGPISWLGAATGAAGGITILISASNSVASMLKPNESPPVPIFLTEAQLKNRQTKPEKNVIFVSMDKKGQVMATGPNGTTVLRGNYIFAGDGGKAQGYIE